MSKNAQQAAEKYASRAPLAGEDYVNGAASTSKDQASLAIAGAANWKAGMTAAMAAGSYEKGLGKSGKAGWLKGVQTKGSERFSSGVTAGKDKYASNSAKFDSARNAAASTPRGPKGSETNIARVKTVVAALRAAKAGK